MKVLTASEMREVDRLTTERYAIPGLLLMENAAARTVEAIEQRYGPMNGKQVLVISGRGNNGGDGAAIARQLHARGALIHLLLLGRVADAGGDARTNFEIARALASTEAARFRFVEVEDSQQFQRESTSRRHDLYVDAIFGTGLTRPAAGLFEEAIRFLNQQGADFPVVAIDVPSGVASDSANLIGPAVQAHLTVTFTAPKPAGVLPPAADLGGELVVAAIGSPDTLIRAAGSRLNLIERRMVADWLRSSCRTPLAHKGDAGKVLIVAGSRGKTGAACLSGEAALRAGAGLVTVATAVSAQPVVASRIITECMTEALAETASGSVAREAADEALALAGARDVVALGPGLGSDEESTREFVRRFVSGRTRPLVLDADGLNALAPWDETLRGSDKLPLILTPHPGEMARLTGRPVAEINESRVEAARDFATAHGLILVLKGSRTLIAAPDGQVYVNPTGDPGMAKGGTGDVLTGILAGFLGQRRDDALAATLAAVYVHGLAGDLAAARIGTRAMLASDLSLCIGEAFVELGGAAERFDRRANQAL